MNKKRILSAVLALVMVLGMAFSAQAACIASEVKVKFNGKTIVFNSASEPTTLKQVEKKWGKKTGTSEGYSVWEKGGATVMVAARSSKQALGSVSVIITDTSASVAGVSVGMTKTQAMKKLKGIYGENNVLAAKKGQDWDFYGEDGYILIGNPKSEEDVLIYVLRGHFYPIYFYLENDTVSEIRWSRL